jgi:hypothetical protein
MYVHVMITYSFNCVQITLDPWVDTENKSCLWRLSNKRARYSNQTEGKGLTVLSNLALIASQGHSTILAMRCNRLELGGDETCQNLAGEDVRHAPDMAVAVADESGGQQATDPLPVSATD